MERTAHDLIRTAFDSSMTIISVIDHLEFAMKCDEILVLDKGQVVSFGSPDYVVENCDLFAALKSRA